MNQESRVDSEWVALNAFRELLKIATKGDGAKSTYDEALEFGGELYPDLLGPEASILRRVRESNTTNEYRQRARLRAQKTGKSVTPLELLLPDIEEIEDLLNVAAQNKEDRGPASQIAAFRIGVSEPMSVTKNDGSPNRFRLRKVQTM